MTRRVTDVFGLKREIIKGMNEINNQAINELFKTSANIVNLLGYKCPNNS